MTTLAKVNPWIAPVAGVVGIVIGAVPTTALAIWAERWRWARDDVLRAESQRREDLLRFHDERRRACARLLQATRDELKYGMAPLWRAIGVEQTDALREVDQRSLEARQQAYVEGKQALGELELLCTADVAEAARTLAASISDEVVMHEFDRSEGAAGEPGDNAGVHQATEHRKTAEQRFLDLARAELGIVSPDGSGAR